MIEITEQRGLDGKVHAFSCRTMAALAAAMLVVAGCGLSKPGTSDIEQYVTRDLNQCPLWKISDVRKVDGMEGNGGSYLVEFAAKLTLVNKDLGSYTNHQFDKTMAGCHRAVSGVGMQLMMHPGATQFDVSGAGAFVKSESGWRLNGDLQVAFATIESSAVSSNTPPAQNDIQNHPSNGPVQAEGKAAAKTSTAVMAEKDACMKSAVDPFSISECLQKAANTMEAEAMREVSPGDFAKHRIAIDGKCEKVEDELAKHGVASGSAIGAAILDCHLQGWASIRNQLAK